MSCVREGSLEPPYHPPHDGNNKHGEGRTGRFLRGLRRMFKRRGSASRQTADSSPDPKSRSTSELLDAERHARKNREGVYGSGLSVSHDSVFTGERSGDESSDERPTPAHGLGHIVSSHRAELAAAVRRRGRGDASDDDEDLGLPRSPPASPPTDKADKRHHAGISHSSCSDGSLLSVGSSEMDEDSSSGTHHLSSHEHSSRSDHSDFYNSSEPPTGVAPLSHSAAKHKMAVRPRRTHGAPRRKRNNPIAANALPITPELNEELIRSATPDVLYKSSEVVSETISSSIITKHHGIAKDQQQMQLNRELQRTLNATPTETKLKSSSLPPGLALSQLVGHAPNKLAIAEPNTPRSSIKRSKSSSQGKALRDDSPNRPTESQRHLYSDANIHRSDDTYADETCLTDKKSKSDKKTESEGTRSKKEESFFSRLLLRKSGKKPKKDQINGEGQDSKDNKKNKTDKLVTPQYKTVDAERPSGHSYEYAQKHEKYSHKTSGQRAFSNQIPKRLDNKGAYVQEGVYKDAYSAVKVPGIDYNITDLKIAEETDKMLNMNMRHAYRREEPYIDKLPEKSKRSSSKEAIDDFHNLHHERPKRPQSNVPRLKDPFSSKDFINSERSHIAKEKSLLSPHIGSEDEPPLRAPRLRSVHSDYVFHSGSMPKNIPYFNPSVNISASASPPKSIMHQSSESIKKFNRSSEHMDRPVIDISKRAESSQHTFHNVVSKIDSQESYINSGLRSLGEEYVESRSSIGKSHSFRYASETNSISSQESQMPSLPAIVGISEPLLESWESNYRRSVILNSKNFNKQSDHYPQKASTRNYNLNIETNYDSLPSTDSSSYLDSLKNEDQSEIQRKPLFTNNINIKIDNQKTRNNDISQIEAKIDDIISSPKPVISSILKSSSLDSVTSAPERPIDDKRKTISVESALSYSGKLITGTDICKDSNKLDIDNFISVTHLNKEPVSNVQKLANAPKIVKSEEKQTKTSNKVVGVPEFLNIQLNKVDAKPSTNIVLTANVTPKKLDTQQSQIDIKDEEEIEIIEASDINDSSPLSQKRINKKMHEINVNLETNNHDNIVPPKSNENMVIIRSVVEKSPNQQNKLPSPTTPKMFFKRKSISVDLQDKPDKSRTNSISTDGSNEKIYDNISMDRKSHSSFGSKSSIQSTDSNEARTPDRDRQDDIVVFRKKPAMIGREFRSERRNDDEPELMKVFARRSLKLKDSEADILSQELAEANNAKEEIIDSITATKSKTMKNEFNASIKSRDSDKENEEVAPKDHNVEQKFIDIAARVSKFGAPHYQRSVSISSVASVNANTNPKRESAPPCQKSEVNKYKKEISDSTPEKRLRNRTFPDSSNDREDIKSIGVKSEAFKADTLSKRPWQKKEDEFKKTPFRPLEVKEKNGVQVESAVIEKEEEKGKEEEEEKEKESVEGVADGSPQFRGILQMRAEWERRAKQGMTK